MKYMYIPAGITGELVRSAVGCDWKGQIFRIIREEMVTIQPNGQTAFGSSYIEGITLGTGEKVDEVAGGASGMGMYRIGEVGERLEQKRLLGCMRQIAQQVLWQGQEPGKGRGGH